MEINKVSDHNNTQQPQPKKQVRRRPHTTKPYQERLLNMAEARREIATALKFHRASMKQQQAAANYHLLQEKSNSGPNYLPMPPPPLIQENFDLVLPSQTLGLNLNFEDFNNLNTSIYYNPMRVCSSSGASSAAKEVAVVNPARWSKSLDTIEHGAEDNDDGYYQPFEQVMEFPPWLVNANENSSFQHLSDHHFSDEYSPDPPLPCMDIGEIEGMDGDWLA